MDSCADAAPPNTVSAAVAATISLRILLSPLLVFLDLQRSKPSLSLNCRAFATFALNTASSFRARYYNVIGYKCFEMPRDPAQISYTHLRAHETPEHLVCRLLLE